MNNLNIQNIEIARIREYKNNPKLHNRAQITKIRESIREFWFINPVLLLDENLELIAGHSRVAAARDMGMHDVPAIILSHLTDTPYNVRVKNIGSMGKIKHDVFAMASGEMISDEFTEFLGTFMRHAKDYSADGSLHYFFMDWKHVREIGPTATRPHTAQFSSRLYSIHNFRQFGSYHTTRQHFTKKQVDALTQCINYAMQS